MIQGARAVLVCLALGVRCLSAAEPALHLLRVCDVLDDPTGYDGKTVAIVGRYSFRQAGRFFSEETCSKPVKTGDYVWPYAVRVIFDHDSGPKPPDHLELDGDVVFKLLTAVRERTSLAKLHFGSPDYDRWAVGFGRLETTRELPSVGRHTTPFEPAFLRLVCRGEAEVMFIVNH